MKNGFKFIAPLAILITVASGCSDGPEPGNRPDALLNATWDSGCHENPRPVDDPNSPLGFFRETLLIDDFSATQTIEYFDDANCSVPVTDQRVVDQDDDTFFLSSQSQELSLSFPLGTTTTALGQARHIDLLTESVAINGVTLTEAERKEAGIELTQQLGIYIVTDSERLHLGSTTLDQRPTRIPLDFFYERTAP